jgi:hypothetical protein
MQGDHIPSSSARKRRSRSWAQQFLNKIFFPKEHAIVEDIDAKQSLDEWL